MMLPLTFLFERKHGAPRIAVLWVAAVLAGNFWSAALESPCTQVVGASGGVFGLIGLCVADMVLNLETIRRPVLQTVALGMTFVFFVVNLATQTDVSHMSHVGGLVGGFFLSFLVLPNLKV